MTTFRRVHPIFSVLNNISTVLMVQNCQKGHSKWQNIRHVKAYNDMQRQKLFSKLTYRIGVAIRDNSMQTDPRLNRSLERLLEECKESNMPKATIQRAIERAVSKPVQTFYYDLKGPGGSLFIVEALTENREHTRTQLKKYMSKIGSFIFADQGIRTFFQEIGVVVVAKSPLNTEGQSKKGSETLTKYNLTLEDALNVAVEVGCDDVEESVEDNGQPSIKFFCNVIHLQRVAKELTNRQYVVLSQENEFVSTRGVRLDDEKQQTVDSFFEVINNNLESVTRIFDNIESE